MSAGRTASSSGSGASRCTRAPAAAVWWRAGKWVIAAGRTGSWAVFFFFKQKTAYEMPKRLEFRRVLFRSIDRQIELEREMGERIQAEEALRKAHDELEARVQERTAELARSNAELQQFAYVASHDLQEPLRMVSNFTQLLAERYDAKLDNDGREFIAYAVEGATRMQTLVQDLLALSRVGTRGRNLEVVRLAEALDRAVANLELVIEENGAFVTHDELPEVIADSL